MIDPRIGSAASNEDWADLTHDRPATAPHPGQSPLLLTLLGEFTLSGGDCAFPLSRGCERLVAFLAIRQRSSRRTTVAGTLWPEADEPHARASLRSALVRLRGIGCTLIEAGPQVLRLTEDLEVDLVEARRLAQRIIDGDVSDSDIAVASIAALSLELLPEWYDDWVILEAEAWRQLRLHALEALSTVFAAKRRFPEAVLAAIAAVKADPLRESARVVLVRAHLAENNPSEAIREFQRYGRLLHEQLGLEPSSYFVRLMGSITS